MKIIKNLKTVVLAAVLTVFCGAFAFGQAAPRSYYVRSDGNDDNNGRSEETAFKTMEKAVEAVKAGIIKRITVIGTITLNPSVRIAGAGTDEILITGKEDAVETEKAIIIGSIFISESKVRFTQIKLDVRGYLGSIGIHNATVTLDTNTLVTDEAAKEDRSFVHNLLTLGSNSNTSSTLIMSGNAAAISVGVANSIVGGDDGRDLEYSNLSLIMSGSAKISGSKEHGITMINTVTLSDNAEISGNARNGIDSCGLVTLSGNAQVSNNGNVGIYKAGVTMLDNTKVTGNKGAGIYGDWDDDILLQDQAEVSDNLTGVYAEKTLTLSGSVNISNNSGSGVAIKDGILTINGGTINGKNGGGVYINGKTCTINGGTITANKAEYGAGVYVNMGSFTFTGGSITGNEAEFVGGGVYVKSGTTYTAGAGVVSGNTAGDGGANVFRQ
jgi:hypothetical protein